MHVLYCIWTCIVFLFSFPPLYFFWCNCLVNQYIEITLSPNYHGFRAYSENTSQAASLLLNLISSSLPAWHCDLLCGTNPKLAIAFMSPSRSRRRSHVTIKIFYNSLDLDLTFQISRSRFRRRAVPISIPRLQSQISPPLSSTHHQYPDTVFWSWSRLDPLWHQCPNMLRQRHRQSRLWYQCPRSFPTPTSRHTDTNKPTHSDTNILNPVSILSDLPLQEPHLLLRSDACVS